MKLQKGDIIDIIAPASSCPEAEFLKALEFIESWGLVPRYNGDIMNPKKYLAQTDSFRLEDLKRSLYASDSKAVWCLRGGYGCLRLIENMKSWKAPKHKKLFIGLSDISVLHNFLIEKWDWKPVHGPLFFRLGSKVPAKEKKYLKGLIFQKQKTLSYGKLKALNLPAQRNKDIKGRIVGGNLCSIASLLGSSVGFQAKNKILLLEEIGERGYAVDHLLTQLRNAGVFTRVKAIVFGDFTGGDEVDGKNYVNYALKKFAEETTIPCFKGLKTGHGKLQLPVPLNTSAVIACSEGRELRVSAKCY